MGPPEDPSTRWVLGLFGIRELVLSVGLCRSLRRGDPNQVRLLVEMTALAQAGDVAITAAAALAGRIPRRIVATVVIGAVPTLACVQRIRRGYGV